MTGTTSLDPFLRAASAIAAALWLGGIVALGAFAAPAVFGIVPAPYSGDAMTVAFRRFDALALACAAVVLGCELWRARRMRPPALFGRIDLARAGAGLFAAVLAVFTGAWASPRIEALHRAGAIRGLGEAGDELDRVHHWAELAGKGEVFGLVLYLVLLNITVGVTSIGSSDADAARVSSPTTLQGR